MIKAVYKEYKSEFKVWMTHCIHCKVILGALNSLVKIQIFKY